MGGRKSILRSIFQRKEVKKSHYRKWEIINQLKQLHALLEINEKIVTEQSLSELLDYIVRSTVNFLKADAGTLRLPNKEQNVLVLKSVYGTHRKSGQIDLPINENSTAGLSYLKCRPVNSSNVSGQSLCPWNGEESKTFFSFLSAPLKVKDKNWGVLSLYRRRKEEFSSSEIEIAEIFASQAALAIMNRTYLDQFHRAAITEELTGFYNRGYFYQRLKEETNRAARTDLPLSLLVIDFDHLKYINDSYGHLAGDKALKEISKIIRACIRKVDIPARYGGDELVIILPETNSIFAFNVAERIRKKVANTPFRNNTQLTVSIGIASYPKDSTQSQTLFERADQAMYQAKQRGANRVEIFAINDMKMISDLSGDSKSSYY